MKIYIDPASLAEQFGSFAASVQQDIVKGVERLAAATHAFVVQESDELKSSKKIFQEALKFKQVAEGIWVISVEKKGLWIEEGLEQGYDMKAGLLKDAETVNGKKIKVIPFDHGKPPTQQTPYAQDVTTRIRSQLRKDKINFKKIDVNPDGSPRVGKIATLNYGGEAPGKGNTGVMQGISIYQSAKGGKVRRDILTFRTVTDAPNQKNKWLHPGFKGKKFLDKAHDWALETWEKEILPQILEKWK